LQFFGRAQDHFIRTKQLHSLTQLGDAIDSTELVEATLQ